MATLYASTFLPSFLFNASNSTGLQRGSPRVARERGYDILQAAPCPLAMGVGTRRDGAWGEGTHNIIQRISGKDGVG